MEAGVEIRVAAPIGPIAKDIISELHDGATVVICPSFHQDELAISEFIRENAGICYISDVDFTIQIMADNHGPFRVVSFTNEYEKDYSERKIIIYEIHNRQLISSWPMDGQETGGRYLHRDLVGRGD